MTTVEYGIPTDKEAIQLRLGIARGFFRDEGLNLSLKVVFGGPEIAARYDSGALKIGELGSPPATTALARGARFRIVGSSVRRRALQYLVAHPSIAEWSDLRGKTVAALSIGSCSYWFMRTVLAHHGLDPDKDVNIIGLGTRYPQVTALFDSGELQAAVLSEPNISIGEDGGHFRVMQSLTDAEFCPGMQWSVIVANQVVMEREPELVRAVLRGCVRSYRHAAAHPDELAEFGADYFRITPATMHKSIRREADGLHTECEVDLPGLQQAIALQQRLGAFSVPLDANAIVDARYLPGAAPGVASGVAPGAAA
jgi:NitT/TauT family transport system substrate-binding protein